MASSVRVDSGAVIGLDAFPVEVEVDATPGLHFFNIVGLPDKTVEESKDRIAAALKNSGYIPPKQKNLRIIVNLAPADVRKEGPGYDVPVALGYLLASKQITFMTEERLVLGELSLDGSIRRLQGTLPIIAMARSRGYREVILPAENAREAAIIGGVRVIPVSTLSELIGYLQGRQTIEPVATINYQTYVRSRDSVDDAAMDAIKGQENAKRALMIAAAGGHNILMYGPPGSGKTLLAKALAGLMPPMSHEEAVEVTKIYSVAGQIADWRDEPIMVRRPFRSPHHTTSAVAIVGGGSFPKPGEITLAHRGVLFLDEFPEFPRSVVEALRQPMESGEVTVSRAASSVRFPARFVLVAAMNPCPCGNYGDETHACVCSPASIERYQKKISGPILDRIDIQIPVARESYQNLASRTSVGPRIVDMRATVEKARSIQEKRFGRRGATNSEMSPREIQAHCTLAPDAESLMQQVMERHQLSGRGYHKLLKIARTIADMDNSGHIGNYHVAEAVNYRIKQENQG